MLRRLGMALVVSSIFLLAGCSGGGGAGSPSPGPQDCAATASCPTSPVDDCMLTGTCALSLLPHATRVARVEDVTAFWNGLSAGLTDSARREAVRARLASLEDVQSAGIDEETKTVWAVFRDGVPLMIPPPVQAPAAGVAAISIGGGAFPTRPAGGVTGASVGGGGTPGGDGSVLSPQIDTFFEPGAYPESKDVALFYALDVARGQAGDNVGKLAGWLIEKYWVPTPTSGLGTVEAVLAQKRSGAPLGIFYMMAHGGFGRTAKGSRIAYMTSATPVGDAVSEDVKALLERGHLGHCPIPVNRQAGGGVVQVLEHVWCFTSPFFAVDGAAGAASFAFGENALVVMNGCSTFNSLMRDAFFTHPGVGLYAGWTRDAMSDVGARTVEFLLSRTLGVDAEDGTEKPSRPFPISHAYDHVSTSGQFTSNGAQLGMARKPGARLNHLAPGIEFLVPIEGDEELRISGDFGVDPGAARRRVAIDGTDVEVRSWDGFTIVTELPAFEAAGGRGPVVVSVDDRESNAIPLAGLTGTFSASYHGQGSQQCALEVQLALRGDSHPYRMDIETEPEARFLDADVSRTATTGTLVCTGQHETPCPEGSARATERVTWSGSRDLTASADGDPFSFVFPSVVVSPALGRAKIDPHLAAGAFDTTTLDCSGATTEGMGFVTTQWFDDPMIPAPMPTPESPPADWERYLLSIAPGMEVSASVGGEVLEVAGGSRALPPGAPFTGEGHWNALQWSHRIAPDDPR